MQIWKWKYSSWIYKINSDVHRNSIKRECCRLVTPWRTELGYLIVTLVEWVDEYVMYFNTENRFYLYRSKFFQHIKQYCVHVIWTPLTLNRTFLVLRLKHQSWKAWQLIRNQSNNFFIFWITVFLLNFFSVYFLVVFFPITTYFKVCFWFFF